MREIPYQLYCRRSRLQYVDKTILKRPVWRSYHVLKLLTFLRDVASRFLADSLGVFFFLCRYVFVL